MIRFSSLDISLQRQVESAVLALKSGEVIAIPTDTLYGLAACALSEEAVGRVFRLKRRKPGIPLPLLVAEPVDILRYSVDIPEVTWALAERFWPGGLTLVLRKTSIVPDIVTGGRETVALRVPDHPVPRLIAQELGSPITGTSANRSGSPGLRSAQAVRDEFGSELNLVVDGVESRDSVASTVLDLSGTRPQILRPGAIPTREIEELCDETHLE